MPVQVRSRASIAQLVEALGHSHRCKPCAGNAIDNLTRRKQRRRTAHNERAHTRLHTDFESGEVRERFDGDIEKTVRHLLVRTPVLPQLRIAETHNIKAETAGKRAEYKCC